MKKEYIVFYRPAYLVEWTLMEGSFYHIDAAEQAAFDKVGPVARAKNFPYEVLIEVIEPGLDESWPCSQFTIFPND